MMMPDLAAGRCVPGNSSLPAEAWLSTFSEALREAARHACMSCPVLEPCRAYAVAELAGVHGIIGGLDRRERLALRRAAWDAEDEAEWEALNASPAAGPVPAVTARAGLAAATGTAPPPAAGQPCACGCGQLVPAFPLRPGRRFASDQCRKRQQRRDERRKLRELSGGQSGRENRPPAGPALRPAVLRPVALVPVTHWPGPRGQPSVTRAGRCLTSVR